ncbi:hypothetical protein [Deinococcus multiflagellatus]|uniref:Uncharacterized protein n=1 Tax=Deinococcus multiflagellatus TaxID=1656887 RepID=A0ABW1ZF66_9DEIO
MPEVQSVHVLGNGFITVAHAVITLNAARHDQARALSALVAARVLAARPDLSEVDLSVYDAGTYAGFGGPLPLLTASVPRTRLADFQAWTAGRAAYERQWVNPGPSALPTERDPDRVPEASPALVPGEAAPAQRRPAGRR